MNHNDDTTATACEILRCFARALLATVEELERTSRQSTSTVRKPADNAEDEYAL